MALFGGLELHEEPPMQPFTVEIQYEDISGTAFSSDHVLDVGEFLGISRLDSSEKMLSDALKTLASAVSSGRLNVQVKS